MTQLRRALMLPAIATFVFVVTACSSSPASSSAPSGAASQPGGESVAPAESTGTSSRDWCLNTGAEVSAVIGGAAVTAAGSDAPGIGGGCLYTNADGKLVYALSVVTASNGPSTFQAGKSGEGVETLSGIGDDAILMSAQGPLVVLKGNVVISLGLLPDSGVTDAAEFKAKNEQLAKQAVARL